MYGDKLFNLNCWNTVIQCREIPNKKKLRIVYLYSFQSCIIISGCGYITRGYTSGDRLWFPRNYSHFTCDLR